MDDSTLPWNGKTLKHHKTSTSCMHGLQTPLFGQSAIEALGIDSLVENVQKEDVVTQFPNLFKGTKYNYEATHNDLHWLPQGELQCRYSQRWKKNWKEWRKGESSLSHERDTQGFGWSSVSGWWCSSVQKDTTRAGPTTEGSTQNASAKHLQRHGPVKGSNTISLGCISP